MAIVHSYHLILSSQQFCKAVKVEITYKFTSPQSHGCDKPIHLLKETKTKNATDISTMQKLSHRGTGSGSYNHSTQYPEQDQSDR